MEAVILAGGKGTRLQPYTSDIPKPLVPLNNAPIIEILLKRLRKGGVTRAYVAVNHLANLVMAVLGDGSKLGMQISYSVEDRPLGTVGPLKLIANLSEHFIVANGDVISDIPIDRLYDFHVANEGLVTVATHRRTERIDFGVLESEPGGRVVGFTEKPSYHFSVSMGIYVFSRDVLKFVPDRQPFGFDELILSLLAKDEKVMNYPYEGFWLDIGRPDDYERAIREYSTIEQLLK